MTDTSKDETIYEAGATTDPDRLDGAGKSDPDLIDDEDELANDPDVGGPSDSTTDPRTADLGVPKGSEEPPVEDV
jgi:hypothetical protein